MQSSGTVYLVTVHMHKEFHLIKISQICLPAISISLKFV